MLINVNILYNKLKQHYNNKIYFVNTTQCSHNIKEVSSTELFKDVKTYTSSLMQCGYPEKYMVDTIRRALRIYDKMLEEDHDGTHLYNYDIKYWNVVARRK